MTTLDATVASPASLCVKMAIPSPPAHEQRIVVSRDDKFVGTPRNLSLSFANIPRFEGAVLKYDFEQLYDPSGHAKWVSNIIVIRSKT